MATRKEGEKVQAVDEEVSQARQGLGCPGREMGTSLDTVAKNPGMVFFPEMC